MAKDRVYKEGRGADFVVFDYINREEAAQGDVVYGGARAVKNGVKRCQKRQLLSRK